MRLTRRQTIAMLVLSLVLALGGASAAYGVDSYMNVSSGQSSYTFAEWYILDGSVVSATHATVDLNDARLATWTPGVDLGGIGDIGAPTATGVVNAGLDSTVRIDNSHIYAFGSSEFQGPQAVFSTSSSGLVNLFDCYIYGDPYAARGLYTQSGGTINAEKCTIVTDRSGDGAGVATGYDGGGLIYLHDCEVRTYGATGSPAFYSSGGIAVNECEAYAYGSEAAWIDGRGDIAFPEWPEYTFGLYLVDSSLYSYNSYGVSFVKGPLSNVSDDERAGLRMKSGYLESAKALFYAPNSKAIMVLEHMKMHSKAGVLLTTKWTGEGFGGGSATDDATKPGSRESTVKLHSVGSELRGDIITDKDEATSKDSVVDFYMTDEAWYAGTINGANQGVVNLSLSVNSVWEVTGTSHVGVLDVPRVTRVVKSSAGRLFYTFSPDLTRIKSNGHTVYYSSFDDDALWPRTYDLPDGGVLVPVTGPGPILFWN